MIANLARQRIVPLVARISRNVILALRDLTLMLQLELVRWRVVNPQIVQNVPLTAPQNVLAAMMATTLWMEDARRVMCKIVTVVTRTHLRVSDAKPTMVGMHRPRLVCPAPRQQSVCLVQRMCRSAILAHLASS